MNHAGWGTAFRESVDRIRTPVASALATGRLGALATSPSARAGRQLPARALAWLADRGATGADNERDPTAYLVETGVLVEDESADGDLVLDPGFEGAWFDRIRAVDVERRDADALDAADALDDLLGADDDRLAVERHGAALVAWVDGRKAGQWESPAALAADVAAAEFLGALDAGWRDRPAAARCRALGVLRLFLDRCPRCEGRVAVGEDVVESCCRPVDVVAVRCESCGARLFESLFDPSPLATV